MGLHCIDARVTSSLFRCCLPLQCQLWESCFLKILLFFFFLSAISYLICENRENRRREQSLSLLLYSLERYKIVIWITTVPLLLPRLAWNHAQRWQHIAAGQGLLWHNLNCNHLFIRCLFIEIELKWSWSKNPQRAGSTPLTVSSPATWPKPYLCLVEEEFSKTAALRRLQMRRTQASRLIFRAQFASVWVCESQDRNRGFTPATPLNKCQVRHSLFVFHN